MCSEIRLTDVPIYMQAHSSLHIRGKKACISVSIAASVEYKVPHWFSNKEHLNLISLVKRESKNTARNKYDKLIQDFNKTQECQIHTIYYVLLIVIVF